MPLTGATLRLLLGVTALVVACIVFAQLFYDSSGYTYGAAELKRNNKRGAELNADGNHVPCRLPNLNPWDEQIMRHVNPLYDPFKTCVANATNITWLVDGKVVLNETLAKKGIECDFRCNYPNPNASDHLIIFGNWTKITKTPHCDIVEVRCVNASVATRPLYNEYLHVQAYRRPSDRKPGDKAPRLGDDGERAPDVHILLFDAVSSTQFFRSMVRTAHYLREEMGAVPFRFLNKVGLNSAPNGYAFLMGKRMYHLFKSPLNDFSAPAQTRNDVCVRGLDNETFIGYEYKRQGYKTLMSEDWALSSFVFPDCKGFKAPPTDHYMAPFFLRMGGGAYKKNVSIWRPVLRESCKLGYHYQLEYLKDFIDTYENEPKWSLSWMNSMSHDNPNGMFHTDRIFRNFLEEHKEKLKNSFLFILGDHGYRHGSIRQTRQGELEDNNPLALVVVPERLRSNERLMRNLRQNSMKLVTHYDTFATLHNIATQWSSMTPDAAFDEQPGGLPEELEFEGQSYLYPFEDKEPRSCGNQLVPFEYCICQFESVNRTKTSHPLAERLANFMVGTVNAEIRAHNKTHLCAELALDRSKQIEITEWEPSMNKSVYRVTFDTVPGAGRFWGYVRIVSDGTNATQEKYSLMTERLARLDAYRDKAFCLPNSIVKSYCYCRAHLSTTTRRLTTKAAATTVGTTTKKPPNFLGKLIGGLVGAKKSKNKR